MKYDRSKENNPMWGKENKWGVHTKESKEKIGESLKKFYEEKFPEHAKVFNEIYETSFVVWPGK